MGPIQRVIVKTAMRSVRHPKITLAIALVGLVVSVWVALGRLGISSDQNELFSKNETYFRDYLGFVEKFPENEAVYVVVQKRPIIEVSKPPKEVPPERWAAAAEAVAAKLRPMEKYVKSVEYRAEGSAMGEWGVLFDDPERVKLVRGEMKGLRELVKTVGEAPGIDALAIGTATTERFFRSMQVGAGVRPEDFPKSAGIVAEVARSLSETIAGQKVAGPELGRAGGTARDLGYFYEKDQLDRGLPDAQARHLLLVRVFPKRDFTSLTAISDAVESIRQAAREAISAEAFPEFTVTLTGRPVLEADEMRISEHDTRMSEIAAGIVVFIGLALFLMPWSEMKHAGSAKAGAVIFVRGLWMALVAEIALGFGIGWTFGWATIAVGRLNLLSLVFVIALIGIGMDYLIQFLTRYRREAQRYQRPTAIWARVFRYVSPPISTACLGAAGAFLVSVVTPFRGAAELGIIAGGGLLLCLIAGYTVLPAILTLWPPGLKVDETERYAEAGRGGGAGKKWRLVLPAIWIGGAAVLIPQMTKVSFDPNLLNLQAAEEESVKMVRHLETWYAVALSEDLGTLRKVRDAMKGSAFVERTDSLVEREDNAQVVRGTVPPVKWAEPAAMTEEKAKALAATLRDLAGKFGAIGGAEAQAAKRETTRLAELIEKDGGKAAAGWMNAWQPAFVGVLKEAITPFTWAKDKSVTFDPLPAEYAKLPAGPREHYVYMDDGKPLYALYIYPKADLWDQANIAAFVKDIEARALPLQTGASRSGMMDHWQDDRNFVLTGLAPEIYHTTEAIQKSFFRATVLALALIFVLVLIDLRSISQTLMAISVLALGLPMLLAVMGGLQGVLGEHAYLVRFNLANFFGLPILIGAGHEYGVFMVHRYKEVLHNPRRVWRAWDVSDRALLLCAYVTCSAFAFLMFGRHRGMQSLGFVMAAGTACIYLATICVVRPVLVWRLAVKARIAEG